MNISAIAICDDSAEDRSRLRQHIEKYITRSSDAEIYEYISGEDLLATIKAVKFSLIFLDIQMDKMDGNETSRKIREYDDRVLLVFYTGYSEPSPQSFEVQPFRYIMKNMSDEEMDRYINAALHQMNVIEEVPIIEAKIGGRKIFLKPADIVYIEKYKKTTMAYISESARRLHDLDADVTPKIEIRISDKLENLYHILKKYGFGHPHDSYIINFKYLTSCGTTEFLMKDIADKTFIITRSKAREFNALKNDFMTLKYVNKCPGNQHCIEYNDGTRKRE